MKKLRVFPNIKIKRIVPDFSAKNLGTVLFFLLLFPYLITFLFGNLKEGAAKDSLEASVEAQLTDGTYMVNNSTAMGSESIPLELYVADKLARTMDGDWEIEAQKAQAVLIRSGLHWQMRNSADKNRNAVVEVGAVRESAGIEQKNGSMIISLCDEQYGSVSITDNVYQAVAETAGLCMMYDGKPAAGAYFAVSNGATREGAELGFTEYPYLKSVFCSRDFLSQDYNSSLTLKENEFWEIWETIPETEMQLIKSGDQEAGEKTDDGQEISEAEAVYGGNTHEESGFTIYRDNVGYVLYLTKENRCVSGEEFRKAYHINSASFHLSEEGKNIVITVKGAGHGLGMSQFTANEMAKGGSSCLEILNYFFTDVTITKIE